MGQQGTEDEVVLPATPRELAELTELHRIARQTDAQLSKENFPVALRVLPRAVREQLVRAYRFARFVDDIGDEAAGDRLVLLAAVEADVALLDGGAPTLEPVRGLLPLVRGAGLDLQPFRDLIEANRRDQLQPEYETFDELLDYCRLSAAPIGRIILGLAGVDDDLSRRRSDRVCAALQVLEHCQDVGEDARAGRIYLPGVDRRAADVGPEALLADQTSPAVRQVVAQQVVRAEQLLHDGGPLIRQLHGWGRLAVTGYVAGGRATARALTRAHYDVLARPIRPSRGGTLGQAALLVAGR
ncbi:squalene/phytoene synthase family protein [Jatrophihabitans sp.]|uniref:squalene/phytoene synthase family protein n=1 Tax=Jatrophihabitans sp. TaxID=1932789 RepID=UPI0030C683BD|nr:crtB3 [Jatrophihabitans sp.]